MCGCVYFLYEHCLNINKYFFGIILCVCVCCLSKSIISMSVRTSHLFKKMLIKMNNTFFLEIEISHLYINLANFNIYIHMCVFFTYTQSIERKPLSMQFTFKWINNWLTAGCVRRLWTGGAYVECYVYCWIKIVINV